MTRRLKWIVSWAMVLTTLGGLGSHAHANGNMLLARCEQAERLLNDQRIKDPVNAGFCLGYIGAMWSALHLLNNDLAPPKRVCMPAAGIEVGQAIRVAMRFLRDNPQRLAENEAVLVIAALRSAYPCR